MQDPPDACWPGRIKASESRFCSQDHEPLRRAKPHVYQAQGPRRPGRALECPAPQDRHLRMARVHRDRVHDRRRARPAEADARRKQFDGESRRAETILETAGFPETSGEMVLSRARPRKATDPAFKAADRRRQPRPSPSRRTSPTSPPPLISKDGHSALVQFDITGDPEKAIDKVEPILDATAAVAARHTSAGRRAVRRRQHDEGARRDRQARRRAARTCAPSASRC